MTARLIDSTHILVPNSLSVYAWGGDATGCLDGCPLTVRLAGARVPTDCRLVGWIMLMQRGRTPECAARVLAPAHSDAGLVSVFHSAQSLSWTRGMVHGWMSTSKNAESFLKGTPAHTFRPW